MKRPRPRYLATPSLDEQQTINTHRTFAHSEERINQPQTNSTPISREKTEWSFGDDAWDDKWDGILEANQLNPWARVDSEPRPQQGKTYAQIINAVLKWDDGWDSILGASGYAELELEPRQGTAVGRLQVATDPEEEKPYNPKTVEQNNKEILEWDDGWDNVLRASGYAESVLEPRQGTAVQRTTNELKRQNDIADWAGDPNLWRDFMDKPIFQGLSDVDPEEDVFETYREIWEELVRESTACELRRMSE
ncbi:hypothetical protein K402DRAFT_419956 [Aulographum hederae CBS 113979]|uniref:Uncharacterized protein n=1 Tax=Aulographum hederae CBS 113979 TaxID=1176131 RepID=A0A6G1H4H2_9PEZI|nr:hypothetical protein K402DRAFT_419956 [Aulographum hederae CBS 113979]